MKSKIYCKYCGLELENNKCSCDNFKNKLSKNFDENNNNSKRIICDTCGKTNDSDAVYCEY